GVVPDDLNERVAEAVGAGFVRLTAARQLVTVHDMRTSSAPLAEAFGRGAAAQGAEVIAAGLGSTDMLYYPSGVLGVPGALITASHTPARLNGIKLCRAGAKPVGQETGLADLKEMVRSGGPAGTAPAGRIVSRHLLSGDAGALKK